MGKIALFRRIRNQLFFWRQNFLNQVFLGTKIKKSTIFWRELKKIILYFGAKFKNRHFFGAKISKLRFFEAYFLFIVYFVMRRNVAFFPTLHSGQASEAKWMSEQSEAKG